MSNFTFPVQFMRDHSAGAPSRSTSVIASSSLLAVLLLITACAQRPVTDNSLVPRTAASAPSLSNDAQTGALVDRSAAGSGRLSGRESSTVRLGTGIMVGKTPSAATTAAPAPGGGRPVSFSFENGDVREIVRNVLGDLLNENYIIDPQVTGTITMRTAKPIPESAALPLLESVLRGIGASLVRDGAYWRVQKDVSGLASPVIANRTTGGASTVETRGTNVVIVPIRQIGAREMLRLLKSFNKNAEQLVQVDDLRNLLFITAPQPDVQRMLELVDMFDVDLLAGMSFLLYRIQNGDTKTIMTDLNAVLAGGPTGQQQPTNPFAGLLRVVPIERMNALLLISPEARVIQEAQQWIERLDEGGAEMGTGQRLYVYNLRYTQAEKLQPILQQALGIRGATTTPSASVAPGQTLTNVNAPPTPIPGQQNILPGNTVNNPPPAQAPRPQPATGPQGATQPGAIGLARNANVVADKDRNALLIVATPSEYAAIESVLRRLDTPLKQVAIEVQIAEVALDGDFQFGLQTFFQGKLTDPQNRMTSANGSGSISIPNGSTASLFTYTWKKTDAIQAILSMSESKNQIRTLAQPTLITMDNQKATFNSGRQISVRTQTQSNTGTTVGTVDSFQYINTGISINVTPRVSGENVILEIQQEISDAAARASGGGNPDISKSSTTTTVMAQSGDTMLIGGLFTNNASNGSSGFPVLSSIPVVGGLFGNQQFTSRRSEIALLITPRILANAEEAREVVDDLRRGLQGIETFLPRISTKELPTRGEDRSKLLQELRALDHSMRVTPAGQSGTK